MAHNAEFYKSVDKEKIKIIVICVTKTAKDIME